jgi:hypothetical protein
MAKGQYRAVGLASGFGGRGKKKGFSKATFSMDPEQLVGLRREAARRMVERGAGRVDASELVREAVGAWLRKRGRER